MVLDFQSLSASDEQELEQESVPNPSIAVIDAGPTYGKFVIEPLLAGFGLTLGNPLRRVLYSSLPGTAITWVKIDGVLHEYSTIPDVKEEVQEFLLNVKAIRLRSQVERPGKLRLEVAGEGEVCAGDIMASSDFEVVNPELHLATLNTSTGKLSVEFNVERGTGYHVPHEDAEGLPIGMLPVDALFTPIRKVNYTVINTRVGQRTDFEKLEVEIWTDGSITPIDAMRQAAQQLVEQFFMLANVQKTSESGGDSPPVALRIPAEHYNVQVERLDLSSRTLNCLKRAGINRVGEVLEMNRSELLRIRNFGEKSYHELFDQLRDHNLLPPELDPALTESEVEEEEDENSVAAGAESGEN
jgi:DNA-directed RNA polymerase subunit alpha